MLFRSPLNTGGDKTKPQWHPREHSFGATATEAWSRFLNTTPDDIDWDRLQTWWINKGYCPKEVTMEVHL